VLRELEEVRGDLRRGLDRPANRENWGPIKRFSNEVAALERELAEARSAENRRAVLLKKLSEAQRERKRIGLDNLRKRGDRAGEHASLERTSAETEKRMREIQGRRERIEGLAGERERISARADAFPAPLRACDERACDGIRRDLEREDILRRDLARGEEGRRPHTYPVILTVGALLVIGGAIGWALWTIAFAVAVAAGIMLVAWSLARARGGGAPADHRKELDLLGRRRQEWAGDRGLAESRELLREFVSWRTALNETDARLREALRGYGGAGGHGRSGADEPSGTAGGEAVAAAALDSLRAEFVRLSAEWHALDEKRRDIEPFRLDADGLLRLEDEIVRTEKQARELDGTIESIEREMMGLPEPETNVPRERLASAREALDRAEQKDALVDLLLETLETARGRVAGFLSEKLPPMAGRYLSVITGGRYDTVHVDPVKMHIQAVPAADDITEASPAADDITEASIAGLVPELVPPEKLSHGTRDQIYFAVRLAIIDLLGGREPQPLILDDSFVHFDAGRRERALELIREFSDSHQVLLLSCDPAYERLDAQVIRLR
jgi:DNA repair exonuclease SbcCD ATPase subunit